MGGCFVVPSSLGETEKEKKGPMTLKGKRGQKGRYVEGFPTKGRRVPEKEIGQRGNGTEV